MAWPASAYTLGSTPEEAETAREAWAAVANAIVAFQPVTILVIEREREHARRLLDPRVEQREARLDDSWMRDIGPTFVLSDEKQPRLGAVDWVFNGWGAQEWASWEADAQVARTVAQLVDAEVIGSELVAEGGGLHTDGQGTFLVTETVMQDPDRNLGWARDRVEARLARAVGARKVIWLPRGLTADYGQFGARGHVDLLATFTEPGRVLVHHQRNDEHPDHEVSRRAIDVLRQATDAECRPLEVRRLPAPRTLRDECGWSDYSYVNHVVCNGAVIVGTFDDPADEEAAEVLAEVYPGREIVPVDARRLFAAGGGAHCITQQQPVLTAGTGERT
ncbi:agmatine deiminase [Saccharothrix ecbatanensis]|uniref:Agmatine deiminase n=2 Tax=Saccharothrix ecbatanensis TaxID=1105145 RepID=A0A7W9HJM6_9PSEU|nr:agmatine deiminase [Saccharothrix ecbatanensis]